METAAKQKRLVDSILNEIDREAEITKRLFEVIPEDKLSFRPHPKAKSLGELAWHIATTQGGVARLTETDTADASIPPDREAESLEEILEAFEESLKTAREIIGSTDDERARSDWTATRNGQIIMTIPRADFWRSILLNHYYHHRGQLSVYLRELDVKLPSIYGPSADTNPFE